MGERTDNNSMDNKEQPKRKILLMGSEKSGKTSMFSIIFTQICPIETSLFENTKSISLNKIIFSGGEFIELNDCGGKEKYIKEYTTIKNDNNNENNIFKNVFSFIFVISAENQHFKNNPNNNTDTNSISINQDKDFSFLQQCISLLKESSPDANIFILVNKMDKETSKNRDLIHKNEKNIMEKLQNFNPKTKIKFYYTSIWDESLYTPWRQIMSDTILKNIKIQNGLQSLLKACDADDIFLIEKNTFLCIYSVNNGMNKKIEEKIQKKISFLLKKLKLSIRKFKADFNYIRIKMNNIMVYFSEFINYSYIMILCQRPKINCAFLETNISILKNKLENIGERTLSISQK